MVETIKETWISYGGGVQTFGMLLMAKDGLLPYTINGLIFSDTAAEFPETYKHIEEYVKPICEQMNIPFITVSKNEGIIEGYKEKQSIPLPGFRLCTVEYKREPLRRFVRERFNDQINSNPGKPIIRFLIGISTDEAKRTVKRSKQKPKYILNDYPFIEMDISRRQIIEYIQKSGYPTPRKSGCYICPYWGLKGFVNLKVEHPELFKIAVEMEQAYFERVPGRKSGFIPNSRISLKNLGEIPSLYTFSKQIPDDSSECKSGDSCFL